MDDEASKVAARGLDVDQLRVVVSRRALRSACRQQDTGAAITASNRYSVLDLKHANGYISIRHTVDPEFAVSVFTPTLYQTVCLQSTRVVVA